ncbi:MAG: alpha/beta fold hydrolase, partial [Xanthomonadales bacterium]|nr:alpha/beta fold hydrolase [Xanthomonadales bacterium]
MSAATQFLSHDQPVTLASGEALPAVTIAYETWGRLNDDRSNAVLILTGLSPSAHAASSPEDPKDGWWEPMVGSGKPIDSDRFFIICVNSLGSCWGSTGPASERPDGDRPWRLAFPELAIEDIAATADLVLQHYGIEQLAAIVGPSMGGMSAQAWMKQNPRRARHAVLISTTPAAEPFAIAIRSLQREAITSDPAFQNGEYTETDWPASGMRMA